ncbi:MAG TPA: BrnT family toxin [Pyrinomonadaceae bacterium]|nr:BrnT family toxin [Pyrinomonadaceae bacterium]
MQFEWDKEKAAGNLKKHGVSFEEAETVFGDSLARIFDDEEHSFDEKRNGIVGHSTKNRLLIISFTEKENDTIRIISARETTPMEKRKHENANG